MLAITQLLQSQDCDILDMETRTFINGDGVTIFSADGLVQVPFSMADDVIAAQLASISAAHDGYQVFFYEESALLQHAYEHGTIPSEADGAAAAPASA